VPVRLANRSPMNCEPSPPESIASAREKEFDGGTDGGLGANVSIRRPEARRSRNGGGLSRGYLASFAQGRKNASWAGTVVEGQSARTGLRVKSRDLFIYRKKCDSKKKLYTNARLRAPLNFLITY